eukprot:94568_1
MDVALLPADESTILTTNCNASANNKTDYHDEKQTELNVENKVEGFYTKLFHFYCKDSTVAVVDSSDIKALIDSSNVDQAATKRIYGEASSIKALDFIEFKNIFKMTAKEQQQIQNAALFYSESILIPTLDYSTHLNIATLAKNKSLQREKEVLVEMAKEMTMVQSMQHNDRQIETEEEEKTVSYMKTMSRFKTYDSGSSGSDQDQNAACTLINVSQNAFNMSYQYSYYKHEEEDTSLLKSCMYWLFVTVFLTLVCSIPFGLILLLFTFSLLCLSTQLFGYYVIYVLSITTLPSLYILYKLDIYPIQILAFYSIWPLVLSIVFRDSILFSSQIRENIINSIEPHSNKSSSKMRERKLTYNIRAGWKHRRFLRKLKSDCDYRQYRACLGCCICVLKPYDICLKCNHFILKLLRLNGILTSFFAKYKIFGKGLFAYEPFGTVTIVTNGKMQQKK